MWIKKGVKLIEEKVGDGAEVKRQSNYLLAIRITLSRGEVVDLSKGGSSQTMNEYLSYREDGYIESQMRIDRENLISGIFYAVESMKVGGYRKVEIAPHLAYKQEGIPGLIPPNAKITAEIEILKEISWQNN